MKQQTIEISIAALQQELETMSLAARFFSLDAEKLESPFPIIDRGHQPLLGVFWQQTAMQLALTLSAWCKVSVSYEKASEPASVAIALPGVTDAMADRIRALSETFLTQSMLAKAASCAGLLKAAGEARDAAAGAAHSLRCLFMQF